MDKYFQQALSDFTFDAASGGAIRHLAKLGYTAKEVYERLTFPTPYERVRREYTKCLLEEGILLREKPEPDTEHEKYEYVQEEGRFGRKSFRRVKVRAAVSGEAAVSAIANVAASASVNDSASAMVSADAAADGRKEPPSYVACTFAIEGQKDGFQSLPLTAKQKEYLEGICWEQSVMYHVLNERMREIVSSLSEGENVYGK